MLSMYGVELVRKWQKSSETKTTDWKRNEAPSLAALNAAGRGKSRGPPRAWAGSPREPKHCEHRPEESWAPKPRGDGVRDTLSRSST